ncbi:MAG: hypothetical protein AAFV29_15105, partial [Myxococcota bacterium]
AGLEAFGQRLEALRLQAASRVQEDLSSAQIEAFAGVVQAASQNVTSQGADRVLSDLSGTLDELGVEISGASMPRTPQAHTFGRRAVELVQAHRQTLAETPRGEVVSLESQDGTQSVGVVVRAMSSFKITRGDEGEEPAYELTYRDASNKFVTTPIDFEQNSNLVVAYRTGQGDERGHFVVDQDIIDRAVEPGDTVTLHALTHSHSGRRAAHAEMRKRLDDKVLGTNTFVNRDQPRWDFHIQKNLEAAAEEIAASATQSGQPETRVQGGVSGADLVAQGQVPFEDAESSLNALFGLFPELQPVNPDATGQVDLSELGAIHDAAEVLLASESMPLVGGVVDDDLNGTNDAHLASPFYDVVAIGPGSDDASELFEVPLRLNDLSAEDVPTVLAARLDAAEIWDIDGLDLFEQLVQPLMSTAIVEAVVREEEGFRSMVLQISDTLEMAEGAQRKPMMEIELSDDGRVAVTSSLDEVRPSATPLVTSLEVSDGLDQLAARVTEELGRFAGFYSFELRVGVAELPDALSAKYSD